MGLGAQYLGRQSGLTEVNTFVKKGLLSLFFDSDSPNREIYWEKSIPINGDLINMNSSSPKDAYKLEEAIEKWTVPLGNLFVSLFHRIALFGIGAATVWSAAVAFLGMVTKGSASIEDLLLLFIYLEIGAMVGIYFKTNHMPVRFLIYVAITAVTRLIIDLVNTKHEADMAILLMGLTILILALANAIVRYASYKYPSRSGESE